MTNYKVYKFILLLIGSFLSFQLMAQWELQNSGVTDDLTCVSLVSPEIGYVGGAYGLLLKTTDGGTTWTEITSNAFTGYVSDLRFISPDTGYVHGWGDIFKTYNGGNTWSQVYSAPSWHYFAMDFWDEDHFTIAGREQVNPHDYWTTKAGISGWNGGNFPQSSPSSQYHDMQYLSADTILALRFGGISRSTDGGDTWIYQEGPAGNHGWNELFYVNHTVGYVGGTHYGLDQGIVHKTTDGGHSYTEAGLVADGIRAIHFVDENYGFVGCEGGYIYKTEDGGVTWYGEQHGISTIKHIDFIDHNIGCFVTEAGEIYTTTNGGNLIPNTHDASLLETDLHNVLNIASAPYTIRYHIRNNGSETMNSLTLNYQIDGGNIESMSLSNLGLGNLSSTITSHNIPWVPSLGEHTVDIWIDSPNGELDQDESNNRISMIVTVFNDPLHNRNVLAEDATGAWCGWCPQTALDFDTLSSWYNINGEHRFIPIAQHNGDWMTTEESDTYALMWSGGAFPSSWYDRFRYFGNASVRFGFDDNIVERLDERLAMDAPVNIDLDLDYNPNSREVTINIDAAFIARVDGDFRVHCWVLENGLLSNQSNFYDDFPNHPYGGAGDPIIGFVNNHVLRTVLTDTWGDAALPSSVPAGFNLSESYTYMLPNDFDENNVDIVVFISEHNDKIDQRSILNAKYATIIGNATPTFEVDEHAMNVVAYPSPFHNEINIAYELATASDIKIEVRDLQGKLLLENATHGQAGVNSYQIDTKNLVSGLYLLTVISETHKHSLKLVKQ
ncbi:MAG: Omp28-related outer membrane protein [Chitinophagales bacterium]|nr:Omp28-related outer membrane protein [Chitinophagales bacterium]